MSKTDPHVQLRNAVLDDHVFKGWMDADIHDRMPVIVDASNYDLWLDPGMQNVAAVGELLKPYDACLMRCYPVSTRINHVANDDAECCHPMPIPKAQDRLFG